MLSMVTLIYSLNDLTSAQICEEQRSFPPVSEETTSAGVPWKIWQRLWWYWLWWWTVRVQDLRQGVPPSIFLDAAYCKFIKQLISLYCLKCDNYRLLNMAMSGISVLFPSTKNWWLLQLATTTFKKEYDYKYVNSLYLLLCVFKL